MEPVFAFPQTAISFIPTCYQCVYGAAYSEATAGCVSAGFVSALVGNLSLENLQPWTEPI